MVTRQSSPSFFLRYQALIRPPGPPPTIARSSMFRFCFRGHPPPAASRAADVLSHFGGSAFFPEGKMNERGYQNQNSQKIEKRPACAGLFPNILNPRGVIPPAAAPTAPLRAPQGRLSPASRAR